MARTTPAETVNALLAARTCRDIEAALACYEANAAVVLEPGKIRSGIDAIRGFTEAAMNLPLVFGERTIVESADTALHLCRWHMRVPGATGALNDVVGCTSDVLKKQHDGSWLFAIDNGWGASIVPEGSTP